MLARSLAVLLSLSFLSVPAAASITNQEELDGAVGAFYSDPVIDPDNIYQIGGVTISRDIGTFELTTGTVYLTKSVQGVVRAAVFIGDGTATIEPVRPLDRRCLRLSVDEHLSKKCDGTIRTKFTQLLLVSFEDDLAGLRPSLTRKTSGDMSQAAAILEDRFHVMNWLEIGFDLEFARMKAGLDNPFLYIDFKSTDFGWLVYAFDPREQFETALAWREKTGASVIGWRPLIRTHRREDLDEQGRYIVDARDDQKTEIDVQQYKMEITIPNTKRFQVEADVTFTPLIENLPVVEFDLRNNIPVPGRTASRSTDEALPINLESVTDATGQNLPFVHRKHKALVIPPKPLGKGESYTFHFSLDEETIIQISSVHYGLLNTYPWFPQHGYLGGQYSMDWTVKAKKPLRATGSGRLVEEKTEGPYNVTRLTFEQRVQFPSLIFGQYQKKEDAYEGDAGVELAVYSWPRTTFTTTDRNGDFFSFEVTVPGSKPKSILTEGKEIIKFMENLFGPYPYRSLNIAQMSPGLGFGQAPPGLVQLTGEAFMSSAAIANFSRGNADFFHEFFSHEIAHQWWGHRIGWASDEDVWLSESFAEYAAGLFVMQYLSPERFQGKLKEWRDAARIADPHAPIAWANNLAGTNAGTWRTGLLYNKGPYVLHMLRMQIGHENYTQAMKNINEKYAFQQITTDDLAREIEGVVGYKLDYFFDQWFRDTGIPTFDYSTQITPTEDGKWLATVKISQRDKERLKIVMMPVFFHFGKDKVLVKNRPILKAEAVYQVKLPQKPERISLDDYNTLLADIVAQNPSGQ